MHVCLYSIYCMCVCVHWNVLKCVCECVDVFNSLCSGFWWPEDRNFWVFDVLARASLTAIRYRVEILRSIVRPYTGAVGPGLPLMHDNAWPWLAWRHWCYHLASPFIRPESNEAPLGHHASVHLPPPRCTTDCPGVGWCSDPGLGGDPSGDHVLSHQEHAQTSQRVHACGGHTQ